jgi:Ser/Thr protein kinase RdoA (MazF antagonist)
VLVDDPNRIQGDHPMLTSSVREVVDEALAVTQAHYDALHAASTSRVLHADLHGGNVRWFRKRIAVFDFDDAVVSVPVLDLGISAYYLRDGTIDERPLLEGYSTVAPLPEFDRDQFEALLAGRNLLLLNEMLGAMTANIRAMQQRYVDNTVLRLRAYLECGIYRHEVPGTMRLEW